MDDLAPEIGAPVVLIGPMGVGKSSVLPGVSDHLKMPALDLDAMIEAEAEASVAELFAVEGEAGFRTREARLLKRALEPPAKVIAAGGGAFVGEAAWKMARDRGAIVAGLAASTEVLAERCAGLDRPLLEGAGTPALRRARLASLLEVRSSAYRRADVNVEIARDDRDTVAARVAEEVRAFAARSVAFPLSGEGYRVVIEEGEIAASVSWIRRVHPPDRGGGQLALVADETVYRLHGAALETALEEAGYGLHRVVLPPGEACKTWEVLGRCLDELLQAGLSRDALIVSLGGGASSDLAGLAASLFKRGCSVVHLPTTLLGMIDAAFGGKTAVDHALGKNLIGAFHQPRLVVAALGVLGSLPDREMGAAMGEVVKYALLEGDPGLAWAEQLLLPLSRDSCREVVLHCIRQKARIVVEDPGERGGRIALNLGHSIGHALEAATLDLLHGEAVGLGLLAALRVAAHLGMGPATREARVAHLLERWGLPTDLLARLHAGVWTHLLADKKGQGELLSFVVPTSEGIQVVSLTRSELQGILD